SERDTLIVVRHDGSKFLCFLPGVTVDEEFDAFMSEVCGEINKTLRGISEYENNLICVGGALSSDVGRDFHTMLVAADRALFYIKELEKKGCYLYKKTTKDKNDNLYSSNLEQLVDIIASSSTDDAEHDTGYPELAKIFDFIKSIYEKKHSEMQFVLITVTPAPGVSPAVSDRDEAMEYLRNAIDVTKNESLITFRFSSVQCVVIITEPEKENADSVTDRILNSFYKSYDKKNMVLTTEAASLPAMTVARV
ncbi:MAG: hypothetical protein K2J80_05785, partial [Oscillospiraceae bacterium]|nr:hypothetical protein [Oscillospiraceae bacterium]